MYHKKRDEMITEDYISFGVAKLLKEKGFNERTNMPHIDDYQRLACYIPTLQMAMKWTVGVPAFRE